MPPQRLFAPPPGYWEGGLKYTPLPEVGGVPVTFFPLNLIHTSKFLRSIHSCLSASVRGQWGPGHAWRGRRGCSPRKWAAGG